MAERFEFLEPVRVTKLCGKCGGVMQFKKDLFDFPNRFLHECTKCGHEQHYGKKYPEIEYRTKGGAI